MPAASIFEIQAELCRCMYNAFRIEIVHVLRDGPQRVSEIARITGRPAGTISRHLSVLRNGAVVVSYREAHDVLYQIANPKITGICDLMREVLLEEAAHQTKLMESFQDDSSK